VNAFLKFRNKFWSLAGENPVVCPWTREEKSEVASEMVQSYVRPSKQDGDHYYGMEMYATPYAQQIRQRIIEQSVYSPMMDRENVYSFESSEKLTEARHLQHKLSAIIATDVSHVRVTVECDPWARIKRALRLTKYFPIKQQSFVIEGKILYPHLKVNFPAARHHVKLKLL
jgi:hypothetical protein